MAQKKVGTYKQPLHGSKCHITRAIRALTCSQYTPLQQVQYCVSNQPKNRGRKNQRDRQPRVGSSEVIVVRYCSKLQF